MNYRLGIVLRRGVRISGMLSMLLVALCCEVFAVPITLDFETEDDFSTPLINGQIVDPAFDALHLEFGNLVNISSTQIGGGSGHLGVAVFDSDDSGPNTGGSDKDLLVNLGNILILQNDSFSTTAIDPNNGPVYTEPNDEASFDDRGSIVFDFLSAVKLISLDLIDINGGVVVTATLTDSSGDQRIYNVPEMWTNDVTVDPNGWDTLSFLTTDPQAGEGTGGNATASEDPGFDPTDVVKLDVAFEGSSPSGGLDNLTFVPEPSSVLLLTAGTFLLLLGRRRSR